MEQHSNFPIGIGALSRQTDCKVETIRYYEKEGLLPEPARTAGGHRLYSKDMRNRLLFIRRSRQLGFSMDEIRDLLSLVDGNQVSCERVKSMAEEHLRDIQAKIDDLRKMQRTLNDLASRCSGDDIPSCPIIDSLQR